MVKNIKINIAFFIFLLSFFIFSPSIAGGQIFITEIMYDLPDDSGSDEGREWIEITNVGNDSVNLAGWRFVEEEINHKLSLMQGNEVLNGGSSAIVVSDFVKFKIDWPIFSGTVLDSSFSLKNTSEKIGIRDSELKDIHFVTYNSEWGGKGDGNSLHKKDSEWIAGAPSPGIFNQQLVQNQNQSINNETQTNSSSSPAVLYVKSTALILNIFADAGDDRTVIVGADSFFDGKSFGVEKKPLENAEYIWNFGDGSVKKGQKVMYSYNYPGEYIVFLDVASGEYSSSDRIKVVVVSADLIVSNVVYGKDGFVELYNKTNRELDISWWRIQVGSNFFTIPKNTIILGGKKIIFSYKTTKIEANYDNPIKLLYPNGSIANIYNLPTIIESAPISNKTNDSAVLSNNLTKNESSIINTESSKASAAGGFSENSALPVSNEKEENTASAVNSMEQSGSEEGGKIYKWIFALVGIIFLSTIGIIFSKKTKTDVQQISDQIKIIE